MPVNFHSLKPTPTGRPAAKGLQDATTAILKREEAAKKMPAYLVKEYGEHVYVLRTGQSHIIIRDFSSK